MELKEFIKQTVMQIADGITEGYNYVVQRKLGRGIYDEYYTKIQFDVAVVSDEQEKTGMGGKISVASIFKAGADVEAIQKNTNHSRIKFEINLSVKTGSNKTT